MNYSSQPHALLCWEYGAGLGHVAALRTIARALKRLGWMTTLVNPSTVSVAPDDCFDDILTIPAANQLLTHTIADPDTPIASYNHAVWNFGFHSTKFVFTRLQLWNALFARIKPDLVIADFAPCALMAARGDFPTIALGNGYTLPPVNIKRYPRFFDIEDGFDGAEMLGSVNSALRLCGKTELDFLPEIFRADYQACRTFENTDPFQKVRSPPASGPLLPAIVVRAPVKPARRVFVYLTHCKPGILRHVVDAVSRMDIPVDIYALQNEQIEQKPDGDNEVIHFGNPISLERIISDYSLVIHLGGHSLALELVVSGVPQLLLPVDIEKVLLGNNLDRAGLAAVHRVDIDLDSVVLDAAIKNALEDAGLKKRVRVFADQYPAELQLRPLDDLIDVCVRLVQP